MGAKILVVEDDESMRELLKLHLSNAGYAVRTAEDGIAAGYEVLQSFPDLILCDVEMPHMDGFQFVAAIRADKSLPRIPVVFVTSITEAEHRAKELGCDYLAKPLLVAELLAAVERNLPAKT